MSPRSISFIGVQSSGKTTALAAILEQVDRGEGGLQWDGAVPDRRLLEQLTDPLLDGEFPQRTNRQGEDEDRRLRLPLRRREDRFVLETADYAGEELERVFALREWSAQWAARSGAAGLLLALRVNERGQPTIPRALPPPPRDVDAPFTPSLLGEELGAPVEVAPPAADTPVEVPDTLALIEVLQCLRHARGLSFGERPPLGSVRVGVLLTAWDAVGPAWAERDPQHFLEERMPLLADVLAANFHADDVRAFGFSATGGDLHEPAHRQRYLSPDPGEHKGFVRWWDPSQVLRRSADLSLPIAWVLMGGKALR